MKKLSKKDKIKRLKKLGIKYSKELKANATKAELILIEALVECGILFTFQKPLICKGKLYIVDFFLKCNSGVLIVEIDGNHHYTDKGVIKDRERTIRIKKSIKCSLIRFSNSTIERNTLLAINEIKGYCPKCIL